MLRGSCLLVVNPHRLESSEKVTKDQVLFIAIGDLAPRSRRVDPLPRHARRIELAPQIWDSTTRQCVRHALDLSRI